MIVTFLLLLLHRTSAICITDLINPFNYVTNGDFQAYSIGGSNYQVSTPGNITGWTSTQSQIGKGSYYNSRWGATQVIQLATNNQNTKYNNTVNLVPGVKYKIELQCAAKVGYSLSTSGVRVLWNDAIIFDDSNPTDYQIHTYSFKFTALTISNKLTLQARGVLDHHGTTCDNIKVQQIQTQYNRIQTNGTCVCEIGYYQLPPSQQCLPCPNVDPFCQKCSNTSNGSIFQFKCQLCLWTYYLDNTQVCQACNQTLEFCSNCSMDGSICYSCQATANIILNNGTCSCLTGYYSYMNSCNPCSNQDISCTDCNLLNSSIFICKSCLFGYFTNGSSCIQCTNYHQDCISCSNISCQSCNQTKNRLLYNETCICLPTFYENITSNTCQKCDSVDSNCINCEIYNGSFYCVLCLQGYFSDNGTCSLCNKSITGCLVCSNNGDNCSLCNEDINYFLEFSNSTFTNTCVLCSLIECFKCLSLEICLECNNSIGYFLNSNFVCQACDLQGCLNCSSLFLCQECDQAKNYFLFNATNQCQICSIQGCLICSSLDTCQTCNKAQGYYQTPNWKLSCDKIFGCSDVIENPSETTIHEAVPKVAYQKQECINAENYKVLGGILVYGGYSLMFLSLFSGKIVGLELFGVFQMAHLNLADNQFVHVYLSSMLDWRKVHGFNLQPIISQIPEKSDIFLEIRNITKIISSSHSVTPERVTAIGYTQSFIENVNIMLLILFGNVLIFLIIFFLSKNCQSLKNLSNLLGKQILITNFMFNSLNIGFCLGLHLRYSDSLNTEGFTISTISAILTFLLGLSILIMFIVCQDQGYGQFKQKFKKNPITRSYIFVSIIYRLCLGFHMAYENQKSYQTIIVLGISIAFIIFNITNLSFLDVYQNYRSNLCHIAHFCILMITNYYTGLRTGQQISYKSRSMTGANIWMAILSICFVISAVCLLYELVLFKKKKCSQKQRKKRINGKVMNDNQISKDIMKSHQPFQQLQIETVQ